MTWLVSLSILSVIAPPTIYHKPELLSYFIFNQKGGRLPQTASPLPVGTQAAEEIFSGWISDLQPATSGLLQRQLARLAKESSGRCAADSETSKHGCPMGRALALR